MNKITHLKSKDLKTLRNKILKENNYTCPILKTPLSENKAVLDHIHKDKKTDDITEFKGVVRNTIHSNANVILGKVENAYKRFLSKDLNISLPDLLRSLADYIEKGAYNDGSLYSHPTENGNGDLIKMKQIYFSKRLYNKLELECKKEKIKIPKYKQHLDEKSYTLLKKYNLI